MTNKFEYMQGTGEDRINPSEDRLVNPQERYHDYMARRLREDSPVFEKGYPSYEAYDLHEATGPGSLMYENLIKWDKRFMELAQQISTWSKDPSSKIGAVIVNDERRILATGYNGFPRGIDDSYERLNNRDEKYPRIIHAEMNALMNALYNGVSVKGATIYVFGLPVCSECTKSVIQAGIKRVVIPNMKDVPQKWADQWNNMSEPMYREADVAITYI